MILKALVTLIVSAGMLFAQANLKTTVWRLKELNHSATALPHYTLRFTSDTSACAYMMNNTAIYNYAVDSAGMKFTLSTITCVVLSGREPEFLAAMDSVTRWKSDGSHLCLLSAADTVMRYIDLSLLELSETLWQLHAIKQSSGMTPIAMPEKYTAKFEINRTISVLADCNTGQGEYSNTYDWGNRSGLLTISNLVCTKVNPGPDSKCDVFLDILRGIESFRLSYDSLYCCTQNDTLVFKKKTVSIMESSSRKAAHRPAYTVVAGDQTITVTATKQGIASVRLFTIQGACVRSQSILHGPAKINASGLSGGMYVVQVNFDNGKSAMMPIHIEK